MSEGVEGSSVQLSVPFANQGPATAEENRLRRGVISLPGTIAQSITVMAPALSAAFISYLAAIKAGGATPLAYLLAMGSCLVVGGVVSGFALRLPSAGSLYTYTVHGLGSFWGFVVGCTYLFGGVLAGVAVLAGFAVFTSQLMGSLGAPTFLQQWWLWYAVGLLLYFFLSYFGIVFSTRTQLVFTAATMATLLLLAAIIIGKGGAHGNTLDAFRPGAAGVSWPLILGGLAFGIFSFLGFETAASLAEETRNPRRNIPAAVIGAVVVVGIFYVIVTYATSIGYGVREATTAWPESAGGLAALTRRYAPYLGDWVLLAGTLAGLFSGLATHNVMTRVLYAMGREGVFPRVVGRTHRTHQTPHVAIFLSLILLGAVAPLMISVASPATRDAISAAPGPLSSGFYLFAAGFTIAAPMGIFCLVVVSIAGLRFAVTFDGRWPRARSAALSLGSLVVTTVALIGSLYYSFAEAAPGAGIPGPYRAVPVIGALVVIVAGVVALVLRNRRRDAWERMGALFE
ncbi:MAG: APC family permease [Acidimicrobiia bacterium]